MDQKKALGPVVGLVIPLSPYAHGEFLVVERDCKRGGNDRVSFFC